MCDISRIREIAKMFLYLPVEVDKNIPIIAHHPFTQNVFTSINGDEVLDLSLSGYEDKWKRSLSTIIDDSNYSSICMMIVSPYKMLFLKYIIDYLSPKEIGEYLSNYWSCVEFPSRDVNVSILEMVNFFKKADKRYLMSEEEYKVYENLPDIVTIYRGISDKRYSRKKSLSWTLDRKTAEWFSTRFNSKEGVVLEKKVHKDDILCYFSNEKECIVYA